MTNGVFVGQVSERESDARLRVVDDEASPSEEVLRLKKDRREDKVAAEPVARVPVAPKPEEAMRLDVGEVEDERRTHEPDIDVIIDGREESVDPEEEWTREHKPVPYGWFVLIAVAVIVAVVAATMAGRSDEPTETERAREASVERSEAKEADEREAAELVAAVERRIDAYLRADSVEALLPHVRHRERVEPLARQWYESHEFEPRGLDEMVVFEPINLEGRTFWKALVTIDGGAAGDQESEPILLEQFDDGSVRVDWETSVCFQPMAWDDYVRDRPEGEPMDFRVMVAPDAGGLYSHEFRDESKWRAFRLTTRGSDEYAIGYLRRGSRMESRIYDLFVENRGRPLALVVRLARPAGTLSPRGVVMEELLSPHWLLVDPE